MTDSVQGTIIPWMLWIIVLHDSEIKRRGKNSDQHTLFKRLQTLQQDQEHA